MLIIYGFGGGGGVEIMQGGGEVQKSFKGGNRVKGGAGGFVKMFHVLNRKPS